MNLNNEVWCKTGVSSVAGVGVIAIRDIPKGQRMFCNSWERKLLYKMPDDLLPEIREIILERWPYARENYYVSPNDDARLLSFMNHSTCPNYDKYTDTALRDITKGEEIFEDYGYDPLTQSML